MFPISNKSFKIWSSSSHYFKMSTNQEVSLLEDSIKNMSLLNISIESTSPGPLSPSSRVNSPGIRKRDWASFLRKADEDDSKSTIIADNVHGHIVVPQVCQSIIDTPQFDRLRGLRQLGQAHYVYPAAKHSRWEHSLGVMKLAGEFIDYLMQKKPGYADETDKLCVMMAGLCHDLGHGPFSHLWENFVGEARPNFMWSHEKTSLDMLDYIINENNLMPVFSQHGLNERDITFVKEMIYGPFHQGDDDQGAWPYHGRGPEKFFLYEIVANKISSIDVDKWDYMLRDNIALGIGVTFDYRRFLLHSDIIEVGGRNRLCLRDKEAESVQEMFLDRARLHKKGYQHRTVKIVERMVLDALLAADKHFQLKSENGSICSLSEACDDVSQFSKLTDEFLFRSIQYSDDPKLKVSREILNRISKRQLYKLVGSIEYCGELGVTAKEAEESIQNIVREMEDSLVSATDIAVVRKKISMGMGNKNPVENVVFFDKKARTTSFDADQLRQALPKEVNSETLLVICKRDDLFVLDDAREAFRIFVKENIRNRDGLHCKIID